MGAMPMPAGGTTRTHAPMSLSPADLLPAYREAAAARDALGVPALPLTAPEAQALTQLLEHQPAGEEAFLLHLLS